MNELQYKTAFHEALENYQLSPAAQQTLDATKLVLLNAPSAGGRNTIIAELVKTGEYQFIISDTTRMPRVNNGVLEQNGVEYFFRSETDMLADIQAGEFLEAEVIHEQQVSGISVRELAKASSESKIAITDIEIGGIANVVRMKPDTLAILVLPPSFEVWQQRMRGRGAMPDIELRRRLETGIRIFRTALESDFLQIIINDQLETAVQEIDQLVHTNGVRNDQQAAGKQLAQQLLTTTLNHLRDLA